MQWMVRGTVDSMTQACALTSGGSHFPTGGGGGGGGGMPITLLNWLVVPLCSVQRVLVLVD